MPEFAALVIVHGLEVGSPEKSIKNWKNPDKAPPKDRRCVIRILEELFGSEDCFKDWCNDLIAAWEVYYKKPLFARETDAEKGSYGKPVNSRPPKEKQRVAPNVISSNNDQMSQPQHDSGSKVESVSGWPTLSAAAAQLSDCMADISERCWCAGWLAGLEYSLWGALVNGPRKYGSGRVTIEQIELLRILSNACGGWISWDHDAPRDINPCKWIPLDYWKAHLCNPRQYPLEHKVFADPASEGQRRLLYGFVDEMHRSSWKREALFFDKIVLPDLIWNLDPCDSAAPARLRWKADRIAEKARPFVDLVKQGIFLPSALCYSPKGEVEKQLVNEAMKYHRASPERCALEARLKSLKFSRIHGVDAYPIYSSLHNFVAHLSPRREAILRIVFARIPMPLESVSWDQIVEYRLDPESRRRFAALRVWINRATSGDAPVSEVVEEFEHLLAEFELHMGRHRISYQMMPFEAVVAGKPEVIKEMTVLHSHADNKNFAMYGDRNPIFLDKDLGSPGRELAYISYTNKRFF